MYKSETTLNKITVIIEDYGLSFTLDFVESTKTWIARFTSPIAQITGISKDAPAEAIYQAIRNIEEMFGEING